MKINLGCGDRYEAGWVNVDHAAMPHPKDATVDLTGDLPWGLGTVEMVYAGHIHSFCGLPWSIALALPS